MISKPGSYILVIEVAKPLDAKIGALGKIAFDKGYYAYVGSALNGITARILRHIKTNAGKTAKFRWHIDYLLPSKHVFLRKIHCFNSKQRLECRIARIISENAEPVPGFGCSDCGCKSHLYRIKSKLG